MSEKEPGHEYGHEVLVWLGIGATVAALGGAAVVYGLHRKTPEAHEPYLSRRKLFELDKVESERSWKAIMCRDVMAITLTRPDGSSQREIQRRYGRIGLGRPGISEALQTLNRAAMIQAGDQKTDRLIAPHPDFVSMMATSPTEWEEILKRTQHYDETFDIERYLASIRSPEDPSGSL